MVELKPCPFCGGEAQLRTQEVDYGLCGAWVYCTVCNAKTNYMNTHEMLCHQGRLSTQMTGDSREKGINKAIEAWNRRQSVKVELTKSQCRNLVKFIDLKFNDFIRTYIDRVDNPADIGAAYRALTAAGVLQAGDALLQRGPLPLLSDRAMPCMVLRGG